jgi:5-deoxy-5-amino-3-dehydroquinate synthase
VAIGLVFAARLACRLGRVDDEAVADHRRVVASYDLPTDLPTNSDPAELLTLMARDKKAVDGLTFVLDGPRGVEVVAGVPGEVVEATLTEAD